MGVTCLGVVRAWRRAGLRGPGRSLALGRGLCVWRGLSSPLFRSAAALCTRLGASCCRSRKQGLCVWPPASVPLNVMPFSFRSFLAGLQTGPCSLLGAVGPGGSLLSFHTAPGGTPLPGSSLWCASPWSHGHPPPAPLKLGRQQRALAWALTPPPRPPHPGAGAGAQAPSCARQFPSEAEGRSGTCLIHHLPSHRSPASPHAVGIHQSLAFNHWTKLAFSADISSGNTAGPGSWEFRSPW